MHRCEVVCRSACEVSCSALMRRRRNEEENIMRAALKRQRHCDNTRSPLTVFGAPATTSSASVSERRLQRTNCTCTPLSIRERLHIVHVHPNRPQSARVFACSVASERIVPLKTCAIQFGGRALHFAVRTGGIVVLERLKEGRRSSRTTCFLLSALFVCSTRSIRFTFSSIYD